MEFFRKDFDKKLKSYLTVYKTPLAPDSLDPTVFYFPEDGQRPRLLPAIHAQITNDIEILVSSQPARVKHYVIVGDVVTPGKKNKNSDIKVLVVINRDIKDVDVNGLAAEELLKLANSLSGKLATGTFHKINYMITIRDIADPNEPLHRKYDSIYDIPNMNWMKYPSGLKAQ